jgi:hypothetical protein
VLFNPEIKQKWDKIVASYTLNKNGYMNCQDIIYYIVRSPIGITNRDFLLRKHEIEGYPSAGEKTYIFKSVIDQRWPQTDKIIRAETFFSSYTFKPTGPEGKDTEMWITTHHDTKGHIPKALINMMVSKAPKQWEKTFGGACKWYETHEGNFSSY